MTRIEMGQTEVLSILEAAFILDEVGEKVLKFMIPHAQQQAKVFEILRNLKTTVKLKDDKLFRFIASKSKFFDRNLCGNLVKKAEVEQNTISEEFKTEMYDVKDNVAITFTFNSKTEIVVIEIEDAFLNLLFEVIEENKELIGVCASLESLENIM